jgi:hypothetical protein
MEIDATKYRLLFTLLTLLTFAPKLINFSIKGPSFFLHAIVKQVYPDLGFSMSIKLGYCCNISDTLFTFPYSTFRNNTYAIVFIYY